MHSHMFLIFELYICWAWIQEKQETGQRTSRS